MGAPLTSSDRHGSPSQSLFARAVTVRKGRHCSQGPSLFARAVTVRKGRHCSQGPSLFARAVALRRNYLSTSVGHPATICIWNTSPERSSSHNVPVTSSVRASTCFQPSVEFIRTSVLSKYTLTSDQSGGAASNWTVQLIDNVAVILRSAAVNCVASVTG